MHSIFSDSNDGIGYSPVVRIDDTNLDVTRTPEIRAASLQPRSLELVEGKRLRNDSLTDMPNRSFKQQRRKSKDPNRLDFERRALSASKRWEDLLDAAASATEEDSRDPTPVSDVSLRSASVSASKPRLADINSALKAVSPRSSLPPFQAMLYHNPFQSYNASPLQNTMLPQSPEPAPTLFEPPLNHVFPSGEPHFDMRSHQEPYQHEQDPYDDRYPPRSSATSSGSNQYTYTPTGNSHAPPPLLLHHLSSASAHHYNGHVRPLSSHYDGPPVTSVSPHDLDSGPNLTNNGGAYAPLRRPSTAYTVQYSHRAASPYSHSHSQAHAHTHTRPSTAHTALTASALSVQHYCAACNRTTPLAASYACTECICGICRDCVDALIGAGPSRAAGCPRCSVVGGRFKPFMLDLR